LALAVPYGVPCAPSIAHGNAFAGYDDTAGHANRAGQPRQCLGGDAALLEAVQGVRTGVHNGVPAAARARIALGSTSLRSGRIRASSSRDRRSC